MDSHDDVARMRAEMDQARQGLKEVAGNLWVFYSELIDRGFTAAQALQLTATFLGQGLRPGGGDE